MKETKRILLVEDDKEDQFLFIEALSKIANAVLYGVANNGKEALEKLEKSAILPDLILPTSTCPGWVELNIYQR